MPSESISQNQVEATHSVIPIVAVSAVLLVTALAATFLVVQLVKHGYMISIPNVGVTPQNLTLYTTVGLYGITTLLSIAAGVMLRDFNSHRKSGRSCYEGLHFLKRFITNPSQVGAIAPSSHALAVQITDPIPNRSELETSAPGMRFLEIGAGTGVFTREIVKKLGPNDHLDVVEYDSTFCKQLREEFKDNPQVTVHEISITEFNSEPYDVIVSGLPLNAFTPDFVEKVLQKYEDLIKPNGTVSYFEYIALEKIKTAFLFGSSYTNFCSVLNQKRDFVKKHHATHKNVYRNIPPARVQICTITK